MMFAPLISEGCGTPVSRFIKYNVIYNARVLLLKTHLIFHQNILIK